MTTVGAFGTNDYMRRVCGEANIRAMRAAKEAGVSRFAFISAHDFKIPFLLKASLQLASTLVARGHCLGKRRKSRARAGVL